MLRFLILSFIQHSTLSAQGPSLDVRIMTSEFEVYWRQILTSKYDGRQILKSKDDPHTKMI